MFFVCIQEMQWMAADFDQEKRWKRVASRKVSRLVAKAALDKYGTEERLQKEEQQKLRSIAKQIARQVDDFWADIRRVIEVCFLFE